MNVNAGMHKHTMQQIPQALAEPKLTPSMQATLERIYTTKQNAVAIHINNRRILIPRASDLLALIVFFNYTDNAKDPAIVTRTSELTTTFVIANGVFTAASSAFPMATMTTFAINNAKQTKKVAKLMNCILFAWVTIPVLCPSLIFSPYAYIISNKKQQF